MDEAGEEVIPRCPHEHVNIKPSENKDALRKVGSKEEIQFRQKIEKKHTVWTLFCRDLFLNSSKVEKNCDQMVYLIWKKPNIGKKKSDFLP